jgi:hypothetical protein
MPTKRLIWIVPSHWYSRNCSRRCPSSRHYCELEILQRAAKTPTKLRGKRGIMGPFPIMTTFCFTSLVTRQLCQIKFCRVYSTNKFTGVGILLSCYFWILSESSRGTEKVLTQLQRSNLLRKRIWHSKIYFLKLTGTLGQLRKAQHWMWLRFRIKVLGVICNVRSLYSWLHNRVAKCSIPQDVTFHIYRRANKNLLYC